MAIKTIVVLLVGLALASVRLAEAQQPKKIFRNWVSIIARPSWLSPPVSRHFDKALRELGYIEGQNIAIQYRYGEEGKRDRLPELAAELARLKVDIIVVSGGTGRSGRPRMQPRRFPSL